MSEPSRYERIHWRAFNFLAKLTGWAFLIGGSLLGSYSLLSAFVAGNTVLVNGVPSSDIVNRTLAVVLPFVMALFGVLIVRAKPYFPKLFNKDT